MNKNQRKAVWKANRSAQGLLGNQIPGHISHFKARFSNWKRYGVQFRDEIEAREWYDKTINPSSICSICRKSAKELGHQTKHGFLRHLSLDHDHETNRPRGLLCMACNLYESKRIKNKELINKFSKYVKQTVKKRKK